VRLACPLAAVQHAGQCAFFRACSATGADIPVAGS
jgi:hypothetical protein